MATLYSPVKATRHATASSNGGKGREANRNNITDDGLEKTDDARTPKMTGEGWKNG